MAIITFYRVCLTKDYLNSKLCNHKYQSFIQIDMNKYSSFQKLKLLNIIQFFFSQNSYLDDFNYLLKIIDKEVFEGNQ